jgi:hypothetical protein
MVWIGGPRRPLRSGGAKPLVLHDPPLAIIRPGPECRCRNVNGRHARTGSSSTSF